MSAKQPESEQFEFNFDENDRECVCAAYPRSFDAHIATFVIANADAILACAKASNETEQQATVFSIAERLARRQEAHDSRLYEFILARIKHLQL